MSGPRLKAPNSHPIGCFGEQQLRELRQRGRQASELPPCELYDPKTTEPVLREGALDAARLPSLMGGKRVWRRGYEPQEGDTP